MVTVDQESTRNRMAEMNLPMSMPILDSCTSIGDGPLGVGSCSGVRPYWLVGLKLLAGL